MKITTKRPIIYLGLLALLLVLGPSTSTMASFFGGEPIHPHGEFEHLVFLPLAPYLNSSLATFTPTIAPVPTSTPTLTSTPTPTRTPSPTLTRTPKLTFTQTLTPTITQTPTKTRTATTSPTPTETATSTPTPLPTQVPAIRPYMEYQLYEGVIHTDLNLPPVLPGGQADYAAIFEAHDLCNLVAQGLVDEVWVWVGSGDGITKPHFWEWATSGPGWNGVTPDCGKVVTTMAFNYLREVDVALESFNHRLEGFFSLYFTCDFSTATWPWTGLNAWPWCGSLLSDQYGYVARPFEDNNFIGGCGDAHDPPNNLTNDPYKYSETLVVYSICPTWSQDGSATPVPVSCEDWGCVHWQFHLWWMQNLPGYKNINRNRNGNPHPNWWPYLFGPPAGSPPTSPISLPPVDMAQFPNEFATLPQTPLTPNRRLISLGETPPAMTTRQVYVIYYPGYGGTPRAAIPILTSELIGLLKEATAYHGYEHRVLVGTFLGQDGASYAGTQCNPGTAPDNVHIRLTGIRTDSPVVDYKVEDIDGGGLWAIPCEPVTNWLLYVDAPVEWQADLYFKPFRVAPDGTIYTISLLYADGAIEKLNVVGTYVAP